MAAPTGLEYAREREAPPVTPWRVTLDDHDWAARSTNVDLAPLGLPTAEHRSEYRVRVDVETDRGQSELELPLRVELIGNNGGSTYRVTGTQYRLTLTFELTGDEGQLHWHLEPGGRDAAGRAAVLDLLVAMSGSGSLVLWDPDHGALARMSLGGNALDDSLLEERRFLTDVLAIEAWSGRKLPVPDAIDDEQGELVATVAHWIRQRKMRIRFTSEITGLTGRPVEGDLELRLHEFADYRIFGVWVRLGRLGYRVPVTVLDSRPEGERWQTRFRAPDDWMTATIAPPRGPMSYRNVKAVDAGEIPRRAAPKPTRRRDAAKQSARELVEGWELDDPQDDLIRDEIRRRWPT
jgi:hypothetical protein